MRTLHVDVAGKIATYQKRDGVIVCNNGDYQVKFTFDNEWAGQAKKTARFLWNGQFEDVDFTGDTCAVPEITNADEVEVGVYAGDLHTTTGAVIPCLKSILCKNATPSVANDRHYANEAKSSADRAEAAADRAAEDATEAAAQEVTRLVGEIGVVQTMGDSTVAAMSQKAVSAELRRNSKRITNLEQGLPDEDFVTDSSVAYVKDVPSAALPFAEIERVGGMTYRDAATNTLKDSPVTAVKSVGANLIPFPYLENTKTVNGLTFTVNADGSIHIAGTATANTALYLVGETSAQRKPIKAGAYTASSTGDSNVEFIIGIAGDKEYNASYYGSKIVITVGSDTTYYAKLRVLSRVSVNTTVYPMFNKGSTALPYAPYTESTLPIPAAVQSLDGYGQGINATYNNHIAWSEDGTEKTYNKMVYEFVLDGSTDEVYSINSAYSGTLYNCFTINLGAGKWLKAASVGVCNQCEITTSATILEEDAPYAYFGNVSIGQFFFKLPKATVPDVATLRTYLASNPVIVLYVATPEVTDISSLITSDNLIGVEGGGIVTFENEHGQAVPSTITYQVEGSV